MCLALLIMLTDLRHWWLWSVRKIWTEQFRDWAPSLVSTTC